MNSRIKDILDIIDPPPNFTPWHGGPTIHGCLRGIKPEQAVWKPSSGRNSIWNLVLHMAYWKYNIITHLNPDFSEGFERSPANFPAVPDEINEKNWQRDKRLLRQTHEKLIEQIKAFPPDKLDDICPTKKNYSFAQLLNGIAAHDVYHVGQIQLLKKLYTSSSD